MWCAGERLLLLGGVEVDGAAIGGDAASVGEGVLVVGVVVDAQVGDASDLDGGERVLVSRRLRLHLLGGLLGLWSGSGQGGSGGCLGGDGELLGGRLLGSLLLALGVRSSCCRLLERLGDNLCGLRLRLLLYAIC